MSRTPPPSETDMSGVETCWNCNGEGSTEHYITDDNALYGMDVPMVCEVCEGEGVTDCPEEEWPR